MSLEYPCVYHKVQRNPADNMIQYINDPGKAAREVIEMFNRRDGENHGT